MTRHVPFKALMAGPAMESLFSRNKESLWPSTVLNDPNIAQEAALRQALYESLEILFARVRNPTIDIPEAISAGVVGEIEAAKLYGLLADFLDADQHHARLVLYLPFELLPPPAWRPTTEVLREASARFAVSYMKRWKALLEQTDVRANFFDGNIYEAELAPNGQALIQKAAHLIPQLAWKGLVALGEIETLMDSAASDILRDSLADALPALVPFMLSEQECTRMLEVRGYAMPVAKESAERESFPLERLRRLPEEMKAELGKLDMRAALDNSRGMPPARVAWERKNKEDILVSAYASHIAGFLSENPAKLDNVLAYVSASDTPVRLAVMRGVGVAGEALARTDYAAASKMFGKFIQNLPKGASPDTSDELESILSRAASLGVISEGKLRELGYTPPALDAGFSEESQFAAEVAGYTSAIEKLATTREYSRLLYPAAMFFGSQLKGYARRSADLDVAVFVRPGIPEEARAEIRRAVAKLFPDNKVGGKAVEFWLDSREGVLQVRDFDGADVLVADSTWAHLLLSSVWLGQEETLKELYAKLLPGFFVPGARSFMGFGIRKLWLDEMEREVLQYRLMHKGYRRFFPPMLSPTVAGVENLDPESAFWDSGYRRLATKLFIKRIFLPQLAAEKN